MRALITGITGQDGSYLAEFLLEHDYEVFGLVRSTSLGLGTFERITHLGDQVTLIEGDMLDEGSLVRALKVAQPDEVYNLAAHSFVARSFGQPVFTADVNALGVARILEAIRETSPSVRFYQASSSEMFGNTNQSFQNEDTLLVPASPYAVAKVFGHDITVNYRESYGLFACSGILFNHEGPKRGIEFVTRKVTNAAARIKLGLQHELVLGTMETKRDWGYAGDYVRAMWLMLQQDEPEDYVVATGETHTVQELVERAFAEVGIADWHARVRQDQKFYRPAEVDLLIGDASKARTKLGWQPEVDFATLVKMMVAHDLQTEASKAGIPLPD